MIMKVVRAIGILVAALLFLSLAYIALLVWQDRDSLYLRRYVRSISNVEQIDLLYRYNPEWIRCSQCPSDSCPGPCSVIHKIVITDPEEIDRILSPIQNAGRYASYWTRCKFSIKLIFHGRDGDEWRVLAGIDDCRSFTAETIHATGTMLDNYFRDTYVIELRDIRD